MSQWPVMDEESRRALKSAINVLKTHSMDIEEVVLMIYRIGRVDGGMREIDRSDALFKQVFGV